MGRLSWRARRRGAQLARNEAGTSAVEFAFVLPILMLLLTGMINIGMIMLAQNNMMRTAQNAARNLSLAQMNVTQTEVYIQEKLASFGQALTIDVTLPNTAATPPETDVTVTLSVPMADVMPIDIIGMKNMQAFETKSLSVQITMRQEVPQ